MLTDGVDAKVSQFSFYACQRESIKCYQTALMQRLASSASTHVREREYKVLTECADAKVTQFSYYTFQGSSIKC